MNSRVKTFWRWFLQGGAGGPGYHRLVDAWLFLHVATGLTLAFAVQTPIADVAQKALFPLLGVFVGLTFSWAGNAHALLQTEEIGKLAANRPGGIAEYVFSFQLCILVVLVVIGSWMVPLLQLPYLFRAGHSEFNFVASVILYALISLALRTSWQSVLGANMLLLARVEISGRSSAEKE